MVNGQVCRLYYVDTQDKGMIPEPGRTEGRMSEYEISSSSLEQYILENS